MSNIKQTKYELLPTQYDFLFGYDHDKLKDDTVYLDVSLYQGGFTCKKGNAEYLSPTGWKRIDSLTKSIKFSSCFRTGEYVIINFSKIQKLE